MSDLSPLGLDEALLKPLVQAGFDSPEALAAVSISALQTMGLSDAEIQVIFARVDFYLDRQANASLLCPALPEPCDFVEIDYLTLDSVLRAKLKQQGYRFLNELAFEEKPSLAVHFSNTEIFELERALVDFIDAYRYEKIRLIEV
ncbi:hypothetical protein COW36_06195 [bacterium (Candidatus Blackallbacteria) CG17_big_fil_post_rev_8_21_14_2_50_48_46]|uniref:Uncharacterized protein n=1 Tax=bacterium (Candidatus Blackallbacteria) CG17_big_fil_post_rev_8_21_14_2_50_48_46 TaxID=2014261 RepID=A0A2M7G7S5_9BACT|nr:MAG: hypothetical protein COW64_17025 [bacterium (Candidatus Blackallbacteria) CG18_big_fil_WC_8_21_14_2_50_49_26]PIW18117.1 MAG: hypothetical protein COW36_06195 [bacterium (Candidatus Blackallbacteria) CG17_big_fil_post_rev_8_21_14_2_50_48_46]PIW51126.1 MAG: hypothetical protein COW20_00345 [bacterium (Candidatus Blackallbacteria) CG13_big_fil_rev_8_21_14_2_50_49_14]